MDRLIIEGGHPLHGNIQISGAKNAALPLMCASLLTDQKLVLQNLPKLADIYTLSSVLEHLGIACEKTAIGEMSLQQKGPVETTAPYDMVRKMRASILVLGPLVARHGRAKVSLPGGCAIGNRPINLHLKALEAMGANITLEDGYVLAEAPSGLTGAFIRMPMVSVGATENILMAACLADGETIIENAAREPEITDLAHCLVGMGARIDGIGSERLTIQGASSLGTHTHRVVGDRIEAGSFAAAAAITGGAIQMTGVDPAIMGATIDALKSAGVQITTRDNGLSVKAEKGGLKGIDIRTQPYPGFATDMQAQLMAMLCMAQGASVLTETIFENRFMHVPELTRMGADITVSGNVATVRGVDHLVGAPVMATDLRASMSLVIAALAANGQSMVNRVYHLDRGYEALEDKLSAVGANIVRGKE